MNFYIKMISDENIFTAVQSGGVSVLHIESYLIHLNFNES